jgi:outer membrane beta-barrel protein
MKNINKLLLIGALISISFIFFIPNTLAHEVNETNDIEESEVITEDTTPQKDTETETETKSKDKKISKPRKPRTQLHQRVITALIDESRIVRKKGKVEFAPYFGILYGDLLRTSYIYGVRGGFHINERFEIEGTFGYSHVNFSRDLESLEVAYDRDMFMAGGNLVFHFPAAFLPPRRIIQNDLFLTAGGNIAHFGGQGHLGFNFGGGSKVYITRWVVLRVDVRNFFIRFKTPTGSENTNNLVIMIGMSFFLPP